jgi:histone H3/H4
MEDMNNYNQDYLKTDLIGKLVKHFLSDDRTARLSSDMIKLFTELVFLFIHQALTRTIQQASSDGSVQVSVEHVEKILLQLLLDF